MNDEHDRDPQRHAQRVQRVIYNIRKRQVIAQQKPGSQPAGVSFAEMMRMLKGE